MSDIPTHRSNLPPQKSGGNKSVIIAVVIAVFFAGGLVYYRDKLKGARAQITSKEGSSHLPPRKIDSKAMNVPRSEPLVAVRVDVNKPKELRQFMDGNAWFQDVMGSPLGRGFGSGWSAFLASKGEDISGKFTGTIAAYLLDNMLAQAFSIVWFGTSETSGSPALIVDGATRSAHAAVAALDELAGRGDYTATHCPGESAPEPKQDAKSNDIAAPAKVRISRWLVAEHAVYAGTAGDRIALAAKPTAVLQALCLNANAHTRGAVAIEGIVYPDAFGREAQSLATLTGVGADLRFGLDLQGNQLVPKGLSAPLTSNQRLLTQAPSDELLKLIPADSAVVAVLHLALPEQLDVASMNAHFKGDGKAKLLPREVALVWTPLTSGPTTVALLWGHSEDDKALADIFNGPNPLVKKKACGHLLFGSTAAALERLDAACKGKVPSRRNAEPAVVAGAKAQSSVSVQLHLGALFSSLLMQGYKDDQGGKAKVPPPEIDKAKAQLEALPFFGFSGRVQGGALVPEGFRS